ncbi:hypothetical protein PF005_g13133 [Phytophthora fragariae]|uniref:WW domain-containing protein n=1 Tax=Phytophthora fragariae TaxID=53985 RepID=A0A6A3XPI6_9STRA|nr:hypothetical protein PF009_g14308 [Phytophthora fragariae]KAE9106422.1 hypothetical protein PF007_g13405 [Phytophthora fragariae]KAE9206110.1 hypothetical protein PF005_g13133 [Phytophthora fragariae]KAE9223536.1 hypothetical protein PF004_g12491 [Phytophthora fragariae]KAE9305932.1 hypothetical protein PF001_g12372 [Phytophthora fragariae]
MDRRHSVSSQLRAPGDSRDPKRELGADLVPISTSWDKARRVQLTQLPSGPASAPKKLQQQQSENQQSVAGPAQPLRKAPAGVRLARNAAKRVTKVPKLVFGQNSRKRRGRHALSNQHNLDGDAEDAVRQVNAGVYLLENTKTGHRYFGTTWDLHNAAAQSFHDLQLGVHPHHALSTCFSLYGEAASGIRFRVLEHVSPPSSPKPPSHNDQLRAKRRRRAVVSWMFKRSFRRLVDRYRRDKAALTVQCFTRQHQARRKVHVLRVEKQRAEAIRRIQAFWRACWLLLELRKRIATRKRERAARQIQASYLAWKARREYIAIRDLARRNRAATKMQCMFRARQARKELMRRQVVRRMGACENCRSQLATVYHFEAESELCGACCADVAALGDTPMETIDVNVYRRIRVPIASAQRAYRQFQTRMILQFGTCTFCDKHAVRRSCWSCLHSHGFNSGDDRRSGKPTVGLTFCRSCDALFHERRESTGTASLLQHQRKNIERAYAEDAAVVTIQKYYRRFAQRHTLADLQFTRQTAAAMRVQECYRRHRQRRITRAICAAHRRQQSLEADAALTIQRVVRGHLARCELRRLKREHDCAVQIQCAFRRYQARRVYNAAVVIQSHVRGWLARRVAATLRQERLEKQRNAAACCIQRHVRGFLARRRALRTRQQAAAVLLQSVWRGYVARCELHALRLKKLHEFNEELRRRLTDLAARIAETERIAATRIQTMVRGRQARTKLHELKLEAVRDIREQLRDSAVALEVASATCIQQYVRERITNTASHQRLRAQCCARCFLSRRIVRRMRLEKQSAVRIQRAFRYSRAKRRLARLVDADGAQDTETKPAPQWVELFDEDSGYVYYYHTETGQSVWERPPEMDDPTWTAEGASNENVGEWVEYWDENVGASYFYNVKTGEATWTTPDGYQSSYGNQEDAAAEAWPLANGGAYVEAGNQQPEANGDQYYGYAYGGDQAGTYDNNDNGDGGYYYYYGDAGGADGGAYAYPLEHADSNMNEQYEPVDTEYDINYKIYLTQVEHERQQEQQEDHGIADDNSTQQARQDK